MSSSAGMSLASLAIILVLLQPGSTLQQNPTVIKSAFPIRHSASFHHQSACLLSASATDADDTKKNEMQPSYDWDEQFTELKSFMAKFGHCNFPNNPSKELQKKYPLLETFTRDQRIEFSGYKLSKRSSRSLQLFDRRVRYCHLKEIGFEFLTRDSKWYDFYHELVEYTIKNGDTRVPVTKNERLNHWVFRQRGRRRGTSPEPPLSEWQISLLDQIGFEWESELRDEQWNAKYNELVQFRNKHGHLSVRRENCLYVWMSHQRKRRNGIKGMAALTEEQVKLLDDIDFPWEAKRHDEKWYANYNELQQFQKKYGHCKLRRSSHRELWHWARYQRFNYRKGLLPAEKIRLLEEIGFDWNDKQDEWKKMWKELNEFYNIHGHLRVNKDDRADLYDWMSLQRNRYHGIAEPAITNDRIDLLEGISFCWSLDWRDRTWHEKYTEAAEFSKEHGHVRVTKKENPSLYNWIETQAKRYNKLKGQKPLSEEELEMLEQIDFPFLEGQPRMTWNAMYAKLARYQEENMGQLPTSHKDDPDLNRWMRLQRNRLRCGYGYPPLSDEQTAMLETIDFPRYPQARKWRSWLTKYDELVGFWKQHGYFDVPPQENIVLYRWIYRQRMQYQQTAATQEPLSRWQVYLLERIGFNWASNYYERQWQENYEELVEFVNARGRLPRLSENKKLLFWIKNQQNCYKGQGTCSELLEYQVQKLQQIGVSL